MPGVRRPDVVLATMPAGMLLRSNATATSIAEYDGPLSLDGFRARHRPGRPLPVPLERFIDYGAGCSGGSPRTSTGAGSTSCVRTRRLRARCTTGRAAGPPRRGRGRHRRLRAPARGRAGPPARAGLATRREHRDLSRVPRPVGARRRRRAERARVRGADARGRRRGRGRGPPRPHQLAARRQVPPAARPRSRRCSTPRPTWGRWASPGWSPPPTSSGGCRGRCRSRWPTARSVRRAPPGCARGSRACRSTWARGSRRVQPSGDRVTVGLDDGATRTVDHVLFGTGYRVDIARYPFLDPALAAASETAPWLPGAAAGMESSVPGLHFLGAPAAWSFGPTMRFVAGGWYGGESLARRGGAATRRRRLDRRPTRRRAGEHASPRRRRRPSRTRRARVGRVVVGGDYQGLGIARSLGTAGRPRGGARRRASPSRGPRATSTRFVRVARPARPRRRAGGAGGGSAPGSASSGWVLFPTREETVAVIAAHREQLSRFRVPTPRFDGGAAPGTSARPTAGRGARHPGARAAGSPPRGRAATHVDLARRWW